MLIANILGETSKGETTRGEMVRGETTCYLLK